MTVKASISLTDAQDRFARSLVEKGRFPSLSEVMQQGLDRLRQEVEDEEVKRKALCVILDVRRRGSFVSMKELHDRTERMIERKRSENGL